MRAYTVVITDQTVAVRADGFRFVKDGYLFVRAGEPCAFFHKDSVHGFYESDGDDPCPPSEAPAPSSSDPSD